MTVGTLTKIYVDFLILNVWLEMRKKRTKHNKQFFGTNELYRGLAFSGLE